MPSQPEASSREHGSLAALRERFRDGKAARIDEFRAARPTATAAARLIRALARHVDTTLADLWAHTDLPPGAALVAVGGYGRGELFPHSDVDVLVLLPEAPDEAMQAAASQFVTACWDIGVEPGSSVRTLSECLSE
ncbi:MAG TPA: nucleotidyltransferase domain-containing protein, partial [Rubrivivax sp.]|nr:nucleotidyltransferase domain-containing protein [Rubrivivax sp.]